MPEIYKIICIALVSAFIILVTTKTGIRDTARDLSDRAGFSLIAEMLDCNLCISFWTSLIICLLISPYDISFIVVPIYSTPITRILI